MALTDQQQKAAEAIATGSNRTQAAEAAGVTPRTLRRWLADSVEFADLVSDLQREALRDATGLLATAAPAAVNRLVSIAQHGEDGYALRACVALLDAAPKYIEHQSLEDRIVQLEIAAGLK